MAVTQPWHSWSSVSSTSHHLTGICCSWRTVVSGGAVACVHQTVQCSWRSLWLNGSPAVVGYVPTAYPLPLTAAWAAFLSQPEDWVGSTSDRPELVPVESNWREHLDFFLFQCITWERSSPDLTDSVKFTLDIKWALKFTQVDSGKWELNLDCEVGNKVVEEKRKSIKYTSLFCTAASFN